MTQYANYFRPPTPRQIKRLRARFRLSAREFGFVLGLTPASGGRQVRYYESGQRVPQAAVAIILRLLIIAPPTPEEIEDIIARID